MSKELEFAKEETLKHINKVTELTVIFSNQLFAQVLNHDQCKLSDEELPIFVKYTPKLKNCTYGSEEYKQYLAEMKPALDHHYANSRHHPEHFPGGISDMTLIDLVEMFLDWKAATLRHADGDLNKSIDTNEIRFDMDRQLAQIFRNTVELFEE